MAGGGENTDGMSTNIFGDKCESWTLGQHGSRPPKRDTPPEASRHARIPVTKRVPKRGHAMDPIKKPCAPHRFFPSGSCVFWSRLSRTPHRRMPSLCQGQLRGGERGMGKWEGGWLGDARWEGASGWRERVGVKGESGGEGRELGRLSGRGREGGKGGREGRGRKEEGGWSGEGGGARAAGTQLQATGKPRGYP